MAALEREHFSVLVFVGANQPKVTYEVASVLQRMGDRAAYVKIAGNGGNAWISTLPTTLGNSRRRSPIPTFTLSRKTLDLIPCFST